MFYKTVKVDLQKKYGLDQPASMTLIPIGWLPEEHGSALLVKAVRISEATQDGDNEQVFKYMEDFIDSAAPYVILDWNLKDVEGNKLPVSAEIRKMNEQNPDGPYKLSKRLPIAIISEIIQAVGDDGAVDEGGTIPLESAKLSVISSSRNEESPIEAAE